MFERYSHHWPELLLYVRSHVGSCLVAWVISPGNFEDGSISCYRSMVTLTWHMGMDACQLTYFNYYYLETSISHKLYHWFLKPSICFGSVLLQTICCMETSGSYGTWQLSLNCHIDSVKIWFTHVGWKNDRLNFVLVAHYQACSQAWWFELNMAQ